MEIENDETRLGYPIKDTPKLLNVMGAPRAWIEEEGYDAKHGRVGDVCDDYERLLRVIQLLLATRRLDREDVAEVVDVEEHLF
jgi:hypothetical protein